jgi:maltooligosyltrehalose trehalohydrolase
MARHGFLYQGQWYSWQKKGRGGYAIGLGSSQFVSFLENHDQVANTGRGERLWEHVDAAHWRALTALLLLGPALPLLFQGQEYGSTRPFTYFADHEPDLARAVEEGRLDFLSQFPTLRTPEMRARIPKPGDPANFEGCKLLDEEWRHDSPLRRLHHDLLRLRRTDPVLANIGTARVAIESAAPSLSVLLVRYIAEGAHRLLVVNLADECVSAMNDALFAPAPRAMWTQVWSSEQVQYGGVGAISVVDANPWVIPARSAVFLGSELPTT